MVDGFFRGRWELTHERKQPPVLNVMPFARPLAPSEWRDVEAEAQQLLALLAPEAADARIVLLPPQEA